MRWPWDDTWMHVARSMAMRSRCERAGVGAVIVSRDNRVVATGYNGPPAGLKLKCADSCPRAQLNDPTPDYDNCISIHAEANALMFCDRREREGGTIYVCSATCYGCAKLIANSGLSRCVMVTRESESYRSPDRGVQLMVDSRLTVTVWDEERYEHALATIR